MKLAIFDFDGTLLMRDTLPVLGKEWMRQKRSRLKYITTYLVIIPLLAIYKMGLLTRERFKLSVVRKFNRLFRNMSQEEIGAFFAATYEGMVDLFNPQVLDELKALRAQGYCCILLSGAYSTLLQTVAKNLGIETVIGTELIYQNGIFDHHKELDIIDGPGKLEVLKRVVPSWETVDWQASRSYGDSYSDRFVMEIVGEPVAVNPDPRLLDYARQRGWRIIPG